MKRILYLLTLVALFGTAVQAQTLHNASYENIGRISPTGIVRDAAHRTIGYFEADGTIKTVKDEVLGKISGNEILNPAGERIGYYNAHGKSVEVRDGESNTLGTIERDGTVRNAKGEAIGYAKEIDMRWAVCYFFFHFFN